MKERRQVELQIMHRRGVKFQQMPCKEVRQYYYRKGDDLVSVPFLKMSVIYFVIGVGFGMYMSTAHDYDLTGVHAHINLVGWASFALAGLIYTAFPRAGSHILSKIHFWLHNVGLPLMMIGLILLVYDVTATEFIIPVGAVLLVLGTILFAVNVLMNVRAAQR